MEYIGVFWTNFYLSSIQHGIQCAHTVGKLTEKEPVVRTETLNKWLHRDCTINLRNGGDNESMKELLSFMFLEADDYDWAYFEESEGAMGGMLTCVGVVLPMDVFAPDYEPHFHDTGFEAEIYRKIKGTRLAQ